VEFLMADHRLTSGDFDLSVFILKKVPTWNQPAKSIPFAGFQLKTRMRAT
jgi:hypothetical protein